MSDDEWSEDYVEEAEKSTFECDGRIVAANVEERTIERTGEKARYLALQVQPTSYTGDVLNKQYKIAKQANGKWIPFLKGLMGALNVKTVRASDLPGLVGKEFHWQNVHVRTFKDKETGEDVDVTSFVPTKLLSGAQAPAAAPAQAATPAKPLDAAQQKVLDHIRKTGGTTRSEVEKETGMTRGAVITAVGQLKEAKLIKEEGGALMVA